MFTHDERRIALIGLRERLRLRQLDVARATGVNRSSLSLWENGFATLPTATLDAIEDYLTSELAEMKAAAFGNDRVHVPLSGLGARRTEKEN